MSRTHKDKPRPIRKSIPDYSIMSWFGDGPPAWIKRVWNKKDRLRAKKEMSREEPQVMVNHRHYGSWSWY